MKHHLKHPATLAVTALAIIGLIVTALVALPSEASPAPTLPRPTTTVVAKVRAAQAAEAIRDRRAEAAERAKHKEAVDHLNRVRLLLALRQNRRADSLREIARQRQVAAEAAAQAAAKAAAKAAQAQARAPRPVGPAPAASQGTGRCGGNLPPCCVMNRESGGNIHAQNPHSTASGKWQFLNSTWNGFGGYASAASAPESVQDAKAAQLWAGGAGASHWGGGC